MARDGCAFNGEAKLGVHLHGSTRKGKVSYNMTTIATPELDDSQHRAVELMLTARLALITGGPGTGKTTTVRTALERLPPTVRVELAAPTGKAASRLKEATGRDARTIHRLLGYRPPSGFTHNRYHPLEAELVIVDESSMIDIELMAALLDAVSSRTRVVLVGDVDQLPPVGPGSPFADLMSMPDAIPVARLSTLHRAAQGSWVHRNAPRILRGETPELEPVHDFTFVKVDAAVDVLPTVQKLVAEDARLQVLIPQKPGPCGCDAANNVLQSVLNQREWSPGMPALQRERFAIRPGDRVLQTKNDYELGLFNGSVGQVLAIAEGKVHAVFDEGAGGAREVGIPVDRSHSLMLAYALTVHRAQGSEFDGVLVVAHSAHTFVLRRKLFYTAVTRTRGRVVIVGNEAGLKAALAVGHGDERNTTLVSRIRRELDDRIEP